jgi:phage-related predicted endonuclease protein
MEKQEQKFELIISTESKVLACNIADFEKKADQFLSTLTQSFETDEDFGRAKEEVKILKELEDKTRAAIKNAQQGDINELIAQAEAIAERFRQERLSRDKLVKEKEASIKDNIANAAIIEILDTRNSACSESTISLALEFTMPKDTLKKRINDATKNKRTIDGLTKAVNAEKALVLAELMSEIARLQSRLKLIPISHEYLFSDAVKLIAGEDDLEEIVAQRIEEEKQRKAEAVAEKAKLEVEEQAKVQAEAAAVAQEMETQTPPAAPAQSAVENHGFVIQITLPPMPQADAVTIAREVKSAYGDQYEVTLKPLKG